MTPVMCYVLCGTLPNSQIARTLLAAQACCLHPCASTKLAPMPLLHLQPSLFGTNDGEGVSIVYVFKLRHDYDPSKPENAAALGLLRRFAANGKEADGTPTRER